MEACAPGLVPLTSHSTQPWVKKELLQVQAVIGSQIAPFPIVSASSISMETSPSEAKLSVEDGVGATLSRGAPANPGASFPLHLSLVRQRL